MKFRAIIPWRPIKDIKENAIIEFTFMDLLNPPLDKSFTIRELLIPWLKNGNIPELIHGNVH
jgi:hypothetical protein